MTDLSKEVKEITEKLMIVSNVKADQKLNISSKDNLSIDTTYYFLQPFKRRLTGDSKEKTADSLEVLYNSAYNLLDKIWGNWELHTPTTREKISLTYGENQTYILLKGYIDKLCHWLEKSIVCLKFLSKTYSDVPTYVTLIEDSEKKISRMRENCKTLEEKYLTMIILSPLGIPTSTSKSLSALSPSSSTVLTKPFSEEEKT